MKPYFISLLFKKNRRSSIWQKNMAINIIIGFFMAVIIGEFILFGVFLEKILLSINPDGAPEEIIEPIFLYYFVISFALRFFIQNLPTMDMVHFMHLPIKKSNISIFMQLKSLTSIFNFIPIILLLPFSLGYMSEEFGGSTAMLWFFSVIFLEWTVNFLILIFKRKSNENGKIFWIILFSILAFFALEYFNILSLSKASLFFFEAVLQQGYYFLIPVITLITSLYFSNQYILNHSYLEDLPQKAIRNEKISSRFQGLQNYGKTGSLILNEIRLVFRNKRTKTILYLFPLFLGYGFFFYPQLIYLESSGWLVFVGVFVTGGFLIAYGQYILSWESNHFDFLQASNISRLDFFTAKYYLIIIPTLASYIITIPYYLFGKEILLINTMALFYNLGINAPLLLFTASYNRKRMDLSKGASMNYQGVGINNFLVVIPLMGLPAGLFALLSFIFNLQTALIIFTSVGILGIIFHKFLIQKAVLFFEGKRYLISEGFRQN